VNLPNDGYVPAVDREMNTVVEKFPMKEAYANFPMALDEADHRLFIGFRQNGASMPGRPRRA
jgi:hypothetical protein